MQEYKNNKVKLGWVGVKNLAEFLDTTPTAVYHLVGRGRLPHRRLGRKILFNLDEVESFLSSCPGILLEEIINSERERS